jgi:hypothetical protein
MLGAPGPDPLDIRRAAEVLPIGRLAQPTALTGGLARTPASRLTAVALVVRIARIGMEQFTAVQTLASSSLFHLGSPPSYSKHRRRQRSSPPPRGSEDDPKQDPKAEEETEKIGGGRTRRRNTSARSLRPHGYRFRSALTQAILGTGDIVPEQVVVDVKGDVSLVLVDGLLLEPAVCQPGSEAFEQRGILSPNLIRHLLEIDLVL